jgi:hypothetical protein
MLCEVGAVECVRASGNVAGDVENMTSPGGGMSEWLNWSAI